MRKKWNNERRKRKMSTLIEHIIKLTDHRDRNLLELTLSKALIDILPVQRIVVAKVWSEEGVKRWLDVCTMDAKGGGKVVDPLRVEFSSLRLLEDHKDRFVSLQSNSKIELAWAGEDGPRQYFLPLFLDSNQEDEAILEIHANDVLFDEHWALVNALQRVFGNMYKLLAYSDRDALTGLLNRKSLDDTFYSAVLEEMDQAEGLIKDNQQAMVAAQDRRHRVPPNYWLGSVKIDGFGGVSDKNGHLIAEEVLLLVARIMNSTFRTYDRLYRLGGEQFAVLMHCPDEVLVQATFERLRLNMEKFNFPQVGSVTVTSGFTRISPDDSPSTALERTERAVEYALRQQGANSVISHAELVRKGVFDNSNKVGAVEVF
jgi:diguanylate cyclase (GGDEF)-like protein